MQQEYLPTIMSEFAIIVNVVNEVHYTEQGCICRFCHNFIFGLSISWFIPSNCIREGVNVDGSWTSYHVACCILNRIWYSRRHRKTYVNGNRSDICRTCTVISDTRTCLTAAALVDTVGKWLQRTWRRTILNVALYMQVYSAVWIVLVFDYLPVIFW